MERSRPRLGSWTDAGRRGANQDAVLDQTLEDGRELLAVADGMGGHAGGDVASRRALEALAAALTRGAGLRAAVTEANTLVHDLAAGNPEWQGMGTTLVALLIDGDDYRIASVGDSRAYRFFPDGAIEQVTRDHSFAEEAVRDGAMSREEALRSPWRHALTRAIGTDAEVDIDVFGPFHTAEPHTVLLCTDGLHKTLGDEELARRLRAVPDPAEAAASLGAEALRAGADDNVTIALVAFGPRPDAPAAAAPDGTAMPALWTTAGEAAAAEPPADEDPAWGVRRRIRLDAAWRRRRLEFVGVLLVTLALLAYLAILVGMMQ